MKAQLQALKSSLKKVGHKVVEKAKEATMTEQELREKHGYTLVTTNEQKLEAAREATTIPARRAPGVMNVGRRIIK